MLLFSNYITAKFKWVYEQRKKVPNWIRKLSKIKKKSLRKKIQTLNNGRKRNFFENSYTTMTSILRKTGESNKIKTFKILCIISGGIGFLVSIILKSYMLIPILTIGLALLPMWLLKFKQFRYTLKTNNELSVALSTVSSTYIRNENILQAVKENVIYMNEPVKSVFIKFIRNNNLNADISGNIEKLKDDIDNKIFDLWCDNLIICRQNINQKYALKSIVEQFSSDKALWDELITELKKPIHTLLSVIAMCFASFPVVYQLGRSMNINNMTEIMFESFQGQIIVVAYAIILFYGINKAINLSTSID